MKNTISLVFFCLLFISCKNESKQVDSSANSVQTTHSNKANNKKIKSCFEDYNYNLAEILTKEDVLKHFDSSHHQEIKTEERKTKNMYANVIYSHKSNRTITIDMGKTTYEAPENNSIEFSGLEFSKLDEEKTLEYFDRKYKKLSDQEAQKMIADIEREYADKTKEETEQAIKFVEIRKNMNFIPVQGLGTAAYWKEIKVSGNNFGVELFVLAGTVEFTVKVKIDRDNMINSQVAIAVARDILAKCE